MTTRPADQAASPQTPLRAGLTLSKTETKELSCVRCGNPYQGEVLIIGRSELRRNPMCPTCEEFMKRAEEEALQQKKEADQKSLNRTLDYRRDHIEEVLAQAGVPPRYVGCSRETYQGEFPSYVPVYIFGPIGCGKTHMAVALLREHILGSESRVLEQIKFVRMVDLFKEIRATFKDDTPLSERDLLNYYGMEVDLLVLDDLGVEKITDWVMQTLYDLIDKRYVELKPTIITSNIPMRDFEKLYGGMGRRLSSRIAGMGRILAIEGKDRRI